MPRVGITQPMDMAERDCLMMEVPKQSNVSDSSLRTRHVQQSLLDKQTYNLYHQKIIFVMSYEFIIVMNTFLKTKIIRLLRILAI